MKTNLILLFLLSSAAIFAQGNLQPSIDNIALPFTGDKNNRALIIAVVTEKGEHIFVYGETEKGNGTKPNAQSLFEIGELTSVFTTSMLAVFESQNNMDLNDPVQNYFPENVRIPVYEEIICKPVEQHTYASEQDRHTIYYCFADPSYHPKQMLLCDLATNTSGLPAYPNNLKKSLKAVNPFSDYSLSDLYAFINDYRTSYPTGLHYKFSPLGIAMLGNALSWKAGTDYEALLKLKVLDPLQLQHTGITTFAANPALHLQGHNSKGNKVIDGEFGAMSPALGMHSNAEDLVTFLKVNLNLAATSIQTPLTNTHNPRVAITDDKKLRGSYSALGWISTPVAEGKKANVIWQHGKTNGFASYMGFIQEDKIGVIVLSNSASSVDNIGKEVLQLLYNEKVNTTSGSSNKKSTPEN